MRLRNLVSVGLIFLIHFSCIHSQEKEYRCPPCASDCHKERYTLPGTCPVCGMELITNQHSEYIGYQKEAVRIPSDTIELNAAYYSPLHTENIKGVLVIVHGSAPSTYEDVGFYTKLGTQLGMAVLAFDKRGVGESGGTYEYFTVSRSEPWFNLLAADVLACVNWLKKKPELQQAKLGLFGGSQAGWIMPLAASKSLDIDFMIIGEGVSVSAGEEHYFSQLTGDGDENGISIAEAHERLGNFDGEKGFDPRNILEQLETQTLWFFGTNDPVIPVEASIEELNRLNRSNFQVVSLPNGDHNFLNTQSNERYDLLSYIKPWLAQIGIFE
ncbi:prolyl oligopeptidase family serine peptidase [Muricauda sp. CAU 1633]|uniref:prolyl oligopeptidase family serine peptidase n=1 Tax=Allomuricauda sp. CAU 1633 TaxID=2816036 RepID=UPI001A8F0AA7|nr:prolyl oligopeptidase family serine peptidase [Muricauda sp. CAU 1633]MBO0322638.1 prolyl oligopeptidase family serine peptidase [Muricauda sp. CAU 1633]